MTVKNIRDMLVGPPHPSEATTLRTVAAESPPEREVRADPTDAFTARLPGDAEDHPLQDTGKNPFPGMSVLAISRAIREGKITDPVLRRKADAYIDQYQRLTRQAVYSTQNHEEGEPYVSSSPSNNVRPADSFDSGRNFKWGGHRSR